MGPFVLTQTAKAPPMQAMVLTAPSTLEIQEVDEPAIGGEDLLVEVGACGICGSDIHGFDGSSGRRQPPLIMGHEAAGTVVAVGDRVTSFSPGDRVTFDSTVSCGRCRFCREGQINLCDDRKVLGVACDEFRRHGAFAERVAVPERISYRLPDGLPFEQAALVEAVSIAVHAANRPPIKMGDTAVVVGTGMIGLLAVQAIRLAGCSRVVAVDLSDDRLALSKTLGVDVTLNPERDDVVAEIQALTDGRGADIALEVVGATPTVNTAIDAVRKGGSVVLVGNLAPRVELPLQKVVTREVSLYGSCASNGEYPVCLDLMASGQIRVEPLITAMIPLVDGPDWFHRLHDGEPGAMKVLIKPNG